MRTVRDNDGDKVNDYYLGGGEIVTGEGGFRACNLLVLVRGSATVNPPGGRSPFVMRVGRVCVVHDDRGDRDDGRLSAATPTQVDGDEEQCMDNRLRPGDHVYLWQAYGINPRPNSVTWWCTAPRGVVVVALPPTPPVPPPSGDRTDKDSTTSFDLDKLFAEDGQDGGAVDIITVVSFCHFNRHHTGTGAARARQAASGDSRGKRSGCRRESLLDFVGQDGTARRRPVHKVRYGRAVRRGLLSLRAGVGTALKKDCPGLVLATAVPPRESRSLAGPQRPERERQVREPLVRHRAVVHAAGHGSWGRPGGRCWRGDAHQPDGIGPDAQTVGHGGLVVVCARHRGLPLPRANACHYGHGKPCPPRYCNAIARGGRA
jgi:hypothetical protein